MGSNGVASERKNGQLGQLVEKGSFEFNFPASSVESVLTASERTSILIFTYFKTFFEKLWK